MEMEERLQMAHETLTICNEAIAAVESTLLQFDGLSNTKSYKSIQKTLGNLYKTKEQLENVKLRMVH